MKRIFSGSGVFLVLLFLVFWAATVEGRPIVVLTTDFGLENEAVGLCHGAILKVDPDIAIVDLCHNIKPFDIRGASLALKRTEGFPPNTVFVTVVDPGVGTNRAPVAIKTGKGHFHVAPDNGVLSDVIARQGVVWAFRIDPLKVNPRWKKGTFDGRDLFSPAGAVLASRNGDLTLLGRPMKKDDLVLLPNVKASTVISQGKILGAFIKNDRPYGNAWTNIEVPDLEKLGIRIGSRLQVHIDGKRIEMPLVTSFGEVPNGQPLAYLNSDDTLGFALNMGDFVTANRLQEGQEISVSLKK